MRYIGSNKGIFLSESGEMSYLTVCIVLAVNMLLAFVLLFATVRIQSMNVRNAAKMEMNNLSARIYADIFHSQREANLSSYMKDVSFSASYQEYLRGSFMDGLEKRIPFESDKYKLRNISLNFTEFADRIEYEFRCDIIFELRMFGNMLDPIVQKVSLTGTHNTKY